MIYNEKQLVYFVCDAGMGSSALGASLLQKRLKANGYSLQIKNCAIDELPETASIVICHRSFEDIVKKRYQNVHILTIDNFSRETDFERIVKEIMEIISKELILKKSNIVLQCTSTSSDEAIYAVGNMLLEAGYIDAPYVEGMIARDHALTTYIGNDLAIPHGEYEVKDYVRKTGLAIRIYPDGIDWHGQKVRIVIGIAAKDNDHLTILQNIALKLCEMETVDTIVACNDVDYIHEVFTKEEEL